jgi:hypothetical protein
LDEPSGLDVLRSLLQSIKGYKPVEASESEPVLPSDVSCQVAGCYAPSVFRCSSGWRFCAKHAKLHGWRGERHTFELMATRTLDEIRAAEAVVQDRITSGEGKDEYL